MTLTSVLEELAKLAQAVAALPAPFEYEVFRPAAPIRDWYSSWPATLFCAKHVSSPEVTECFGVYLLAIAPTEKLLYIGKATPISRREKEKTSSAYNIGAEIWNKLGTSKLVKGKLQFVGGVLETKNRIDEADRRAIRSGNVMVSVVKIRPPECISYVETYLQAVVCHSDGCLPSANDRIG